MRTQTKLDISGSFSLMYCVKTLAYLSIKEEKITLLLNEKNIKKSSRMILDRYTISRELYSSSREIGYQILVSLRNTIVDIDRKNPDITLAAKYFAKFKYLYLTDAEKLNYVIPAHIMTERELNTLAFKTLVKFLT